MGYLIYSWDALASGEFHAILLDSDEERLLSKSEGARMSHETAYGIIYAPEQSMRIYLDGQLHAVRSYAGMGPDWAYSLAMDVFSTSREKKFYEHVGDFSEAPRYFKDIDQAKLRKLDEDWRQI
jgi:hypothetical protein